MLSGFNLALVAILTVFVSLLVLVIGQTVYTMLSNRKSEDTGDVDDGFVLRGNDQQIGRSKAPKPSIGLDDNDQENGVEQRSYDHTDLDEIDDVDLLK